MRRLAIQRLKGNLLFKRWQYEVQEEQHLDDLWVTIITGYSFTRNHALYWGAIDLFAGPPRPEVEYFYE